MQHPDSTPTTTETITTDQDACVFHLGEDGGLAFATIWEELIEIQLKVPAEATRYQYIDRDRAAALHAWLGAWLAAHPEARP